MAAIWIFQPVTIAPGDGGVAGVVVARGVALVDRLVDRGEGEDRVGADQRGDAVGCRRALPAVGGNGRQLERRGGRRRRRDRGGGAGVGDGAGRGCGTGRSFGSMAATALGRRPERTAT